MLKIKHLTKSYNGTSILNDLSLVVGDDEIVTIMGKSGSGKTTLLLCILGFVAADSGEILLNEHSIKNLPIEKRHIAYVPQDYGLFPHLSVAGNIAFGLSVQGVNKVVQEGKIQKLLEMVELPNVHSQRNVSELSGGEKQRVALARALAIEPKLFLLDEPLSAIDVETKQTVGKGLRALIKKLRLPAIIITHDPADAKSLGDSLYHLEGGILRNN